MTQESIPLQNKHLGPHYLLQVEVVHPTKETFIPQNKYTLGLYHEGSWVQPINHPIDSNQHLGQPLKDNRLNQRQEDTLIKHIIACPDIA